MEKEKEEICPVGKLEEKRDICLTDLLAVGEKMGLKRKKCMDIISKISLVVSNFESYAEEANIR